MVMAEGTGDTTEILHLVRECSKEFDSALESDFNTSLAVGAFFKLIKGANRIAASESMSRSIADVGLPEFERMSEILGLSVQRVTEQEKQSITELLKKRETLREQKQYQDADKIRDQILQMNVVLLDHKNKTIWMKKEKILSDTS
jgi:cysteinyl-tRNA synthetase